MSVEVPEKVLRQTAQESLFIRFCQEVASSQIPHPYWAKNVDHFDKIFTKFRKHGKSHLPIQEFIESLRDKLELPILDAELEINDLWLRIPSEVPVPASKSWVPVRPRGAILSMKKDDAIHCLPLAEVYATCLELAKQERSLSGVTADSIPAKFLYLFYMMLSEVEPENDVFKSNASVCQEAVTEATVVNPLQAMVGVVAPNFDLSGIINSDMGKTAQSVVAGYMGQIDPNTREKAVNAFSDFTKTGKLDGLFQTFGDLMKSGMTNPQQVPPIEDETLLITAPEEQE